MSAPRPSRDSAFAVIVRGSRVLLVQTRRRRRWQLPGGTLEGDESPRGAARREVWEETGLVAHIGSRTGTYPRADGSVAFVFAAYVDAEAGCAGPRNEIRRQRWVPARKAARLLGSRARRRLTEALAATADREPAGSAAFVPAPAGR